MTLREFQADFSGGAVQDATYLRRPDAIAPLVSLSFGPRDQGDTSEGLLARAWYCRVDNDLKKVFLARAREEPRFGWDEEVEWFSFTGADIDEIDLTPDQNGKFAAVAQRGTNIWIYYFKPAASGFVFEDFGEGRTPVCVLDNPGHPEVSDILVFYIRGGEIRYRVQSDLYTVEQSPGIVMTSDQFLGGTIRDTAYRLHVVYWTRDSGTGQYSRDRLSSLLYPVFAEPEKIVASHISLAGVLDLIVLTDTPTPEAMVAAHRTAAAELLDLTYLEPFAEEYGISASIEGITVTDLVIGDVAQTEEIVVSHGSVSGLLELLTILYTADVEEVSASHSSVSAVLNVPLGRTSASGLLYDMQSGAPADFELSGGTLSDNGDGTWDWDHGAGGEWARLKTTVLASRSKTLVYSEQARGGTYYVGLTVNATALSPADLAYLFAHVQTQPSSQAWGLYEQNSGANNRLNLQSGCQIDPGDFQPMTLFADGASLVGYLFANAWMTAKGPVTGSTGHTSGTPGMMSNNNGSLVHSIKEFLVFADRYLKVQGLSTGQIAKLQKADDTVLASATESGGEAQIDCMTVAPLDISYLAVYESDGTTLVERTTGAAVWPGETWLLS